MGRKQRKMKKAEATTAAMAPPLQQSKEESEEAKLSQDSDALPSGSKKHLTEDSTSIESGTDSSATESSTDSDNEGMPDLETCDGSGADTNAGDFTIPKSLLNPSKHSRGEKKARRLLSKLDLRPVEGVTRVTMRRSKDVLLYIDNPDVFRYVNSDTYFFFGEVKVDDLSTRAQVEAAEKFTSKDDGPNLVTDKKPKENGIDNEEGEGEGDLFDVGGMDDKDIELVMMQANTSRAKAIRALREHENDVVNAIMALTMM